MDRLLTVDNLKDKKHKLLEFDGEWFDTFSKPQKGGVWFVYSSSGSGKSSFVMKLAKYFTRFGKVIYNSREESFNKSFCDRVVRFGLDEGEAKKRFKAVDEDFEAFDKRLDGLRGVETIIVDSIQYMSMSFKQFKAFVKKHSGKNIIIVSQADGKVPRGKLANDIMFDAYIKVWVQGYKAFSKGREIGEVGEMVIWQKGADKFWGN